MFIRKGRGISYYPVLMVDDVSDRSLLYRNLAILQGDSGSGPGDARRAFC